MKYLGAAEIAAAFLFAGAMMPLYPQHDAKDDKQGKPETSKGKPEKRTSQQRQRAPQAKQQPQPQERRPQQVQRQEQSPQPPQQRAERPRQSQPQQPQQRVQQPPTRSQVPEPPRRSVEQARAWQQQRGWVQQGGWQGRDTWQQHRAQRWYSDHRTWAERGGYGGYYVPQDRFALSFGSQHVFRLITRPVIYMGYPRFEYGGFSFLMVDPWPEYWADNWYDADEVYIDYDDGYYLYNRSYPHIKLAITVSQ